jgi:hypothetical protein
VAILKGVPAATTVIERAFVVVPNTASVTVMLVLTVPAAVGVPEITPEALNDNPAGRVPGVNVQV